MEIYDRAKQEKSWMDEKDEEEFIKEMLGIGKKKIDVLEWGAGYSTKYFTGILRSKGIRFEWDAIEYNQGWYDLIKEWKLENVNLFLFKEENPENKRWIAKKPMNEYVDFPKQREKKYDLIFIDGRKRARCLRVAKDFLKENGFVILHDAQRADYQQSFKYYDYKFLTETLWKGKLKKKK